MDPHVKDKTVSRVDRFIFIMGIPIPGIDELYIATWPLVPAAWIFQESFGNTMMMAGSHGNSNYK